MIELAEKGVYPARHLEQVPAHIKSKYMQPIGIGHFQIVPEIRQACTFRRMNLKTTPFPFRKPFQAVFCRNVLYYFTHQDQIEVVETIADHVEDNGWLFTSVTESVRDLSPRWQQIISGVSRKSGVAA